MSYGSNFSKELYFHSPWFFRTVMSSVYGLQQRQKRYGGGFQRDVEFLRKSQYLPDEEIKKYRDEQALNFINEAIKSTPYYQQDKRYHPVSSVSEISGLPALKKEEVRQNQEQLCVSNLKKIPHTWAHTSGTSGKSLIFPLSLDCFRREYAFRALHYEWGGVRLYGRQPFAFCAGHPVTYQERNRPPFWIYDRVNNWLLLSSYHLSAQNLPHYIRELDHFTPLLLGGYPSSIYILALAYRKSGTGKFRPKVVFTSSETLLDYQRKTIEETFGAIVLNWYGNSEMVANIVECEHGELHLKHEHSYVEVLGNHDQPCKPGETGRLVCTGYGNTAFPLIRYDIGDSVTISSQQQPKCGRSGLLIDRIEGRNEDYILTPDGRIVGRLDHLFKDSRNVKEAQLLQETAGELVLRIVKLPEYTVADEEVITKEARLRLGNAITMRFEYCDKIERTANGKFRFIVSGIDRHEALKNIMSL